MPTPVIGIPFRGQSPTEANATRRVLNEIAAHHGYLATSGPTKGQGSFGALALALAAGELMTVRLAAAERAWLLGWLEQQATQIDDPLHAQTLADLARQL